MKLLRIIIIALILAAVAAFIWITAGSDHEALLLERLTIADQLLSFAVLILCVLILLSTLMGLPIFYINLALGFIISFSPALFISLETNLVAVMLTFYMVRFLSALILILLTIRQNRRKKFMRLKGFHIKDNG